MSEVSVPAVDVETFHTVNDEVPKCPHCQKAVVRPNVLMFGDDTWIADRTDAQEDRFKQFTKSLDKETTKLLIVEIGAGTAVPTIRMTSERLYVFPYPPDDPYSDFPFVNL
jgi:NAD-dependent SIR2 family protein deacetylase